MSEFGSALAELTNEALKSGVPPEECILYLGLLKTELSMALIEAHRSAAAAPKEPLIMPATTLPGK